LALLLGTHSR